MSEANDPRFPTTHWTLIRRLKSDDEVMSRRALDDLCAQYHYPLYCYIRRRGLDHHDAEDALHDFLARLLAHDSLFRADEGRGRLRGYLGTALYRFLLNWHESRSHRKRAETSLEDLSEAERRYQKEKLSDGDTPERIFERKWSQELLKRVLKTLGESYENKSKSVIFRVLRPVLLSGGSLTGYDTKALAKEAGVAEGYLRLSLHRLLKEYRVLLRQEVLQTVDNLQDVEDELAHLMSVFQK